MTSWLTACAHPLIQVGSPVGPAIQVGANQPPAPVITTVVSSACGWDHAFYPDMKPIDYGKRWTDREMKWLVDHNANVLDKCPQPREKK